MVAAFVARNTGDRLPDLLQPNLQLVICGSAAGRKSAEAGAYYAGPGNKFWQILFETGLTPRRLAPADFRLLPQFGIGLTDLAKKYAGGDDGLRRQDDDRDGLSARIRHFAPLWLAFNGKRAGAAVLRRAVTYGQQPERCGDAGLFILPSTSGAAQRYWDAGPWHALAEKIRQQRAAPRL